MMTNVVEVVVQTNTVEVIGGAGAVVEVISQSQSVVEVLTAGPQGASGAKIFINEGTPNDQLGNDGDVYLDIVTGNVFQNFS